MKWKRQKPDEHWTAESSIFSALSDMWLSRNSAANMCLILQIKHTFTSISIILPSVLLGRFKYFGLKMPNGTMQYNVFLCQWQISKIFVWICSKTAETDLRRVSKGKKTRLSVVKFFWIAITWKRSVGLFLVCNRREVAGSTDYWNGYRHRV